MAPSSAIVICHYNAITWLRFLGTSRSAIILEQCPDKFPTDDI